MFYLFILLSDTISIELITTHHHIALIMGQKNKVAGEFFPSVRTTTLSRNRKKKHPIQGLLLI